MLCTQNHSYHQTYGGRSTYLLLSLDVSLLRNDMRLAPMADVSCECIGRPPGPLYAPLPVWRRSRMGPPCTVLRPGALRGKRGLLMVLMPDCLSAGAVLTGQNKKESELVKVLTSWLSVVCWKEWDGLKLVMATFWENIENRNDRNRWFRLVWDVVDAIG